MHILLFFSTYRRDSFITHRAFCDALAQESARLPSIANHFYRNNNNNHNNFALGHHLTSLHYQNQTHQLSPDLLHPSVAARQTFSTTPHYLDHLHHPPPPPSPTFFLAADNSLQTKPSFHGLVHLPDLQPNSHNTPSSSNPFNLSFFSNNNTLMENDQVINNNGNLMNDHMQSLFNNAVLPQMSATALLQKAAEIGATSSMRNQVDNHDKHLMDIMNSFANASSEYEEEDVKFGEFDNNNAGLCNMDEGRYQSNNGLTRDFLGVGSMLRSMGGGMTLSHGEINNKSLSSSRLFHSNNASFVSGGREMEEMEMRRNEGNELR